MRYPVYHIASATCVPNEPIAGDDTLAILTPYIQSYFVVASTPLDALDLVREAVAADGAMLTEAEPPTLCAPDDVPLKPSERVALGWWRGVCWKSGRVFFPAT